MFEYLVGGPDFRMKFNKMYCGVYICYVPYGKPVCLQSYLFNLEKIKVHSKLTEMSTYFDILVTYLGEAQRHQNKAIKSGRRFISKALDF